MATFRVRTLQCVICDEEIRARIEIIEGVEQQAQCPECNTPLVSIGSLNLPSIVEACDHRITFEPGSIVISAHIDENRLAERLAEEIRRRLQ